MWCTHTLTLLFYSYMPAKDHAIHSLALCCIEGCTTVLAPRQDVGCNGGARSCDRSSSRSDHLKIIMCMSLIQNPCIYSQPYLAIEHLKIINAHVNDLPKHLLTALSHYWASSAKLKFHMKPYSHTTCLFAQVNAVNAIWVRPPAHAPGRRENIIFCFWKG